MKKNEIRWRTRKQRKTIEVTQTLETLVVPKGIFKGYDLPEKPTITLTIEALPEDWEALYYRFHDNPELLGSLVFINFVEPVYEEIRLKDVSPLRGHHSEHTVKLMHKVRNFVAAAIAYVSYWLKRPKDEWPEELKGLVGSLSVEEKIDIRTSSTKAFLVNKIVWAMCKRKYGKQMEEIGLAGPKSLHGFRKEFIERNDYIEAARYFFQKHGPNLPLEELIDYLP